MRGRELDAPHLLLSPAVLALEPRALWRALRRQPASMWSLLLYLFFEYVRPQTIYPQFDVLPFAQLTLVASVGTALLESNGKRRLTALDFAMLAYMAVVLLSLITAFDRGYGLSNLFIVVNWMVVYWLLSTTVNTQTRLVLLLLTWFLWNLKMSLHAFRSWASIGFQFRDWGVTGAPGWFQNSGEFGIEMCVVFPIALYFAFGVRRHVSRRVFLGLMVLPVTAVTGAIASSSRGALLGLAAVGLWMLARSRYKVRGFAALLVIVAASYALIPAEQKARLSASGDDNTSQSRLTYWSRGVSITNEHPILGVGYKNWLPYYRAVWGSRLEPGQAIQLPHNLFIECMAELGYSGLLILLSLLGGTFWMNAKTRALARRLGDDGILAVQLGWGFDGAVVGYAVSGFFVTVLYYPYLWVNLGMTVALHLSVARAVRRSTKEIARRGRHSWPALETAPAPAVIGLEPL